jgi:hypothetical protein
MIWRRLRVPPVARLGPSPVYEVGEMGRAFEVPGIGRERPG